MSLLTNLISYWSLDGNSNDATATDNDGADTAITYSVANGKINQGAGFNGSTSTISLSSTSFPSGAGARSIAFWLKPTGVGTDDYAYILAYGTAEASKALFITILNTWKINVGKYGANASATSGTALSTTAFNHVVVTIDASGNITYYLNGSADGTATLADMNTTLSLARFGTALDGPAAASNLTGALDEVGIWSRVLTSTEVGQLYNGGSGLAYPLSTFKSSIIIV